jgi:2-amino-4-hydroxy-6-hydroxymethyldihydropteridine diphosphokinase
VSAKRVAHIERVVQLLEEWAMALELPDAERRRWLRAAGLHDALKDAPKRLLRQLAPDAWHSDSLRHGPAAATMARRSGERDQEVLDAVRYHSVGYAGWGPVGRMLYLADYLEPGRGKDRGRRRELAQRVPREPAAVLKAVAAERLGLALAAEHPLLPETVAFWNALACEEA